MTNILVVLVSIALAFSTVEANPLLGVWCSQLPEVEGQAITCTFRSDGTFDVETSVVDTEDNNLFAELFGFMLEDFDLTVDDLIDRGFEVPVIHIATIEGSYTVENDIVTAYGERILLGAEGDQLVEMGQFMADLASQLLDVIDREATDVESVLSLTFLAEAGPLLTDIIIEELMGEEPLIASGFSIEGDRLEFREGEFSDVVFVRQDETATFTETTSWGQIKQVYNSPSKAWRN